MTKRNAVTLALVLLAAGCDEDHPVHRDSGPLFDSGSRDAGVATDAPSTMEGGFDAGFEPDTGVELDAGDVDAPPPTDAGDVDATMGSDAGRGLVVTLGRVSVLANCMPAVPADPWVVSFDVTYDNRGTTPATATITGARLQFTGARTATLSMTVSPSMVGPIAPGARTMVAHTKTASTPDISNDCELCAATVTLELDVSVGGTVLYLASMPLMPFCVS